MVGKLTDMTENTETPNTATTAIAELAMVSLDCADPKAEADFWSAVLGWSLAYEAESYAMLKGGAGAAIGFGKVDDYQPPAWPNPQGTKQFHFDLGVDDIADAERRCVALGATVPDDQPGEERWRVLLDPAGHPFCLTLLSNWS